MSNNENKSLGEIIKDALKEKGLNQSAVAKKMNVSKQVINQIDRRKYFDLEFLENLREHTGLDFTNFTSKTEAYPKRVNDDFSQSDRLTKVNGVIDSLEMSLMIKLKASEEQIGQMANLISALKREALKFGFTII